MARFYNKHDLLIEGSRKNQASGTLQIVVAGLSGVAVAIALCVIQGYNWLYHCKP
ncbi:transmembrane protein, putative [Medicago truncatula]|uniref:Transmembrane protein, putative n=1 Tax=Medicago truncatula TaxID=3880 RepID=G7J992_MEDTR|nr:transmembrane protein, putative [Medicago truncatula]